MTVTLAALADADVLTSALGRVVRNGGAPGVDGVSPSSLAGQWSEELPRVQAEICTASYSPRPLRVLEVPKPDGGLRILGIPVVRDRVVLEALRRVIAPAWEPTFSPLSFAYRPGRSAQDAIAATQRFMGDSRSWIVDLDIEKFFDHVDHVRLMLRLGQRIADPGILDLIADFLRCGRLWPNGCHEATREGIAQGSPLSPLLANIVLDELDADLAARSWQFVRYADDILLLARTEAEARAMLAYVEAFLASRLRLRLNPVKTRIVPPEETTFLGFTFRIGRYGLAQRGVSRSALAEYRSRVVTLARPQPRDDLPAVIHRVASFVRGWSTYFGFAGPRAILAARAHARNQLRAAAWQLWESPEERARNLILLGIPPAEANASAFALHPPDAFATIPSLLRAMPDSWFDRHGLGPTLPTHSQTSFTQSQRLNLQAEVQRLEEENARLRALIAQCPSWATPSSCTPTSPRGPGTS